MLSRRMRRLADARRQGFTMVEVMFSMIVFLMMTLVFAAVFPFAVKASKFSNNYAQAAMIAQHKIDQIRCTAWNNLNSTNLTNLGIVDSGSCAADSNSGFSCAFTNIDGVADNNGTIGYFPSGSTATLTVDPDTASGVPSNSVDNVTIQINWTGAGMPSGSYTAVAKVVESHNQ